MNVVGILPSSRKNAQVIKRLTVKKRKKTTHSLPMEDPKALTAEGKTFWQRADSYNVYPVKQLSDSE
ncbi:hypothetical protein [Streptococcus ferus]|uniref:hypothetical protein n=1 Tax=Streptococcus ferus TaxID=1345 RepID=UPI0035138B69